MQLVDFSFCMSAGLEILAFPCNQFGAQEPGSNEEIEKFVCTRFKAEYPIFDKVGIAQDFNLNFFNLRHLFSCIFVVVCHNVNKCDWIWTYKKGCLFHHYCLLGSLQISNLEILFFITS